MSESWNILPWEVFTVYRHVFFIGDQRRIVLSELLDTICLPPSFRVNCALSTSAVCPWRQFKNYPFYPLNIQIILSFPPVISTLPLGCHSRKLRSSDGPSSRLYFSSKSFSTFQILIVLFMPPVASNLPS